MTDPARYGPPGPCGWAASRRRYDPGPLCA